MQISIPMDSKKYEGSEIILSALNKIRYGTITIILPDKSVLQFKGESKGPEPRLELKNEKFFTAILNRGDIGLGESYIQGDWETENIADLIAFGILNKSVLEPAIYGQWRKIIYYKLKHIFNRNDKQGSKKNISAHYDLGNQFYSQWLDASMTYSSAYWGQKTELTLFEAQQQKYQLILDQLKATPGQHILEVGCGWGGFAEYAGKKGIKVTGITISNEQYLFAKDRISKAGLENLVTLRLTDYRDLRGKFDHAVSIEMIEAVGEKYWPIYFHSLRNLVVPQGRIAIQAIVMNDKNFDRYRAGTDFIQQYIFPGGMLPSEKSLRQNISQIDGQVINILRFGEDYARTLKCWNDNFKPLPNKFSRLWTFYLQYCEGAFRSKYIDVMIVTFQNGNYQ